jgi:hypothetical protein
MYDDKAFFQTFRVFDYANVGLESIGGSGVPKHQKFIHQRIRCDRKKLS